MKKKELNNLIASNQGELIIDEVRYLTRAKGSHFEGLINVRSGMDVIPVEFDNLTLNFKNIYGEVPSSYKITSRTAEEVLKEIKEHTQVYYTKLVEYLNGVKVLPNNW